MTKTNQTVRDGYSAGTRVYRVAPVKCPKCGERIETFKTANGTSVHKRRVEVLARHFREAHR